MMMEPAWLGVTHCGGFIYIGVGQRIPGRLAESVHVPSIPAGLQKTYLARYSLDSTTPPMCRRIMQSKRSGSSLRWPFSRQR